MPGEEGEKQYVKSSKNGLYDEERRWKLVFQEAFNPTRYSASLSCLFCTLFLSSTSSKDVFMYLYYDQGQDKRKIGGDFFLLFPTDGMRGVYKLLGNEYTLCFLLSCSFVRERHGL